MLDYSKFVNFVSFDSDIDVIVIFVLDFIGGINFVMNFFGFNLGGILILFLFSVFVFFLLVCKFFLRYGNGFISDSSTVKCLILLSDVGFVLV